MICPLQKQTDEGAEYVLDYCSGRLDVARSEQFQVHLAHCADCRQVVAAQQAVWNALGELDAANMESFEISTDFDRKLYARIEQDQQKSWWKRLTEGPALGWGSFLHWKPAASVAACAAVLAVGLYVRDSHQSNGDPIAGDPSITAPSTTAPVERADKGPDRPVDVDQVESAIDDIDMLKQLGVVGEDHSGAI